MRLILGIAAMVFVATGCSGGASTDGAAATDASDAPVFVDEPLPALEQLENAPDCATLNLLMVGVQGEDFRDDVELTLAAETAAREALGSGEPVGAYDVHHRVFSDRQGDLGCSDAVMMEVLDSAYQRRCLAWLAAGHGAGETPLLLNTSICLAFAEE